MDILQKAIELHLISFDEDKKYITYIRQGKKRNFQNPEEKVQAETFCRLVIEYGYSAERIEMFKTVQMGVDVTKEADIIVYHDDEQTKPYIVIECKSPDVSEMEFKQAVNQAFSYAHAIAGTTKFVWVTKGNKQEFYRYDKESNKRTIEADLPYYGESNAKKYRYAKGGYYTDKVKGVDTRITTNDIKPVAESALTQIFKQAHDALWAGGQLNPSQAFDELDKLIFCKVWDERNTKKGEPYQFQIFSESKDDAKNLEALKDRIFALYDKGKDKDPEIFNKPIDLSNERIKTVVEYFQSINFADTDLDSKGKAFETFLGTYFRGEFGQYFTPRNVVKFAVEALPITNESRVLDTSCGSGGFLLYVLDKVRKQATAIYPNYETDVKEYAEWKPFWHDFAEKNLFGIEINDQISRVAKMNMIIHDDGHTNVVTYDGLYQIDHIADVKKNTGFRENSFNFVVTNPPFGSIVKQSEKAYMQVDKTTAPYYNFATKELNWIDAKIKGKHTTTGRENQSTEVLFIEQCHKFLKEGGYLAVIVPDGILTNSSSQYVRDSIEEKFRIVAVVSLPQTAFTNTGAGVKSSVLFLKKHTAQITEQIRNIKSGLQDSLAEETNLVKTFDVWEKEKKDKLKPLRVKSEETDEKKKEISEEYSEKTSEFKEDLEERYQAEKQYKLEDYPILMAIADNIGYDAAGKNIYKIISRDEYEEIDGDGVTHTFIKEVQQNDLFTVEIVKERKLENGKDVENTVSETLQPDAGIVGELRRFIEAIEKRQRLFFRLSPFVDSDKVFLVRKGEIERRFDPNFYLKEFSEIKNNLTEKYGTHYLKSVIADMYRYPTFYGIEYREDGIPVIKGENISKDGLISPNQNFDYIDEKTHRNFPRTELKEKDLIFTVRGLIGKVGIFEGFPTVGNINANVIKIRIKEKLDYKFFWIYLNSRIGQKLINRITSGQVQQTITVPDILKLQIPVPPIEVQAQIVEKFEAAYNSKRAKETEAKQMLDSIDAYLLDKLGIETSAESETKTTFFTQSTKLSGGRFDPSFYKPNFQNLIAGIIKQLHKRLREVVKFSSESWNQKDFFENNFPYIEISEIDLNKGEINNVSQVPLSEAPSRAKMVVRDGDIIVSTTRPSRGAIAKITEKENFSIASTGFAVIRNVNSEFITKDYLHSVLRHRICLLQMEQRSSGGNYPAITIEELGNLLIPLPTLEIQEEIAAHIQSIRERAKQLEAEANAEVEKAKIEVEKMILGEVSADA